MSRVLAPVMFRPGKTEVELPNDARPVDVAVHGDSVAVLAEVNSLTAQTVPKAQWTIYGVRIGMVPDEPVQGDYVGSATFQLPDGDVVTVAAYVDIKRVILVI